MNKIFLAGLIAVALLATVDLASATETTFESNWSGGWHHYIFQSGDDARSEFETVGSIGNYKAIDYNDNPYGYSVDTTRVQIKADVVSSGFIQHLYERQDSKTSMYGVPGQSSYSYVGSDETASFAMNIRSNYADMIIGNYGFQSNNQFTATGNHFMTHRILTGTGMGANWVINATGVSTVSQMIDESRASGFRFGEGAGCYTNAKVDIVGSGTYDLYASAPNSIVTQSGITTDGSLHIGASFVAGFNFGNFALKGN